MDLDSGSREYLHFHARRFAYLVEVVKEAAEGAETGRILDVGPAFQTALFRDALPQYTVKRHARVEGDPDVVWVAVARWDHPDGSVEWCVEYWDEQGEADHDKRFATEAEADAQAVKEFELEPDDWRPGANRFGPRQ